MLYLRMASSLFIIALSYLIRHYISQQMIQDHKVSEQTEGFSVRVHTHKTE
jgi:hypothetical protein